MSILFRRELSVGWSHTRRKGCETSRSSVVLVVLMLPCAQACAQERSWTSDKVARGSTSSIALDADQDIHLTYLTKDAKMFYALRPAGVVEVVLSTGGRFHPRQSSMFIPGWRSISRADRICAWLSAR